MFVVELDAALKQRQVVRDRNPAAQPDMPCVYVEMLHDGHPSTTYVDDDFSSAKEPMRTHGLQVLTEHNKRYTRRQEGLHKRDALVAKLRAHGYYVVNKVVSEERESKRFVYVVLLDRSIRTKQAVRDENRLADGRKRCLYVGQTSKSPEERFADHKRGHKASKWVRDYGIRLLPEFYEKKNPLSEKKALWEERNLAQRLKEQGYTVMGGH